MNLVTRNALGLIRRYFHFGAVRTCATRLHALGQPRHETSHFCQHPDRDEKTSNRGGNVDDHESEINMQRDVTNLNQMRGKTPQGDIHRRFVRLILSIVE